MPDWGWVSFAYAVVYLTLAAYVARMIFRFRAAGRRIREPR
ncbi:MAG: hypothetical protein ACE5KX_05555 [Acidimicrobiia bacterium]